jgi:hypothetical protein
MTKAEALERLREIAADESLKRPNWDTYDADPLDVRQVTRAWIMVNSLDIGPDDSVFVCPLPSGGIQIEIEINPPEDCGHGPEGEA